MSRQTSRAPLQTSDLLAGSRHSQSVRNRTAPPGNASLARVPDWQNHDSTPDDQAMSGLSARIEDPLCPPFWAANQDQQLACRSSRTKDPYRLEMPLATQRQATSRCFVGGVRHRHPVRDNDEARQKTAPNLVPKERVALQTANTLLARSGVLAVLGSSNHSGSSTGTFHAMSLFGDGPAG